MNDLIILSHNALRQLVRLQRFGELLVNDKSPVTVDPHGVPMCATDPYRELVAAGYASETHDADAGWYHYRLLNEATVNET